MKKINTFYISILLFNLILNSFLCFGIYNNFKYSNEDSLISIIIMFILGLINLLFYFKLFNYKDDLPIHKKNKLIYGNILGTIINIILVIIFLILGIISLYNISDFISSQYLYKTPNIVISIFLSMVCYLNVSKGLNTITKSSLLLFYGSILLFIISALSLILKVDLSNFHPILKNGINSPLKEGIILFINNILPMYLFLIIPKDNIKDKDNYQKYILISYIFSLIIIFTTVFITLGVSGIYLSRIYQYPEYIVLKNITLFTSIERIENFLSMQWVIYSFISLSMIIYYITSNIKIKNNNNYMTLIITIIICILSKIIFKNNAISNTFNHRILPYILGIFIIIYITSYILISIKRKS